MSVRKRFQSYLPIFLNNFQSEIVLLNCAQREKKRKREKKKKNRGHTGVGLMVNNVAKHF